MCRLCKELQSVGAHDTHHDAPSTIPRLPTRRLDLPRDFWERWGELEGLCEAEWSPHGRTCPRWPYGYLEAQTTYTQMKTLMTGLKHDLRVMLDAE